MHLFYSNFSQQDIVRTNENFGLFIIDDQKFNNSQLSLRVEQHVFLLVLCSFLYHDS